MKFIVTAGPTFEALDGARRLTNFSTGHLGSELARFLFSKGHTVRLLLSETATYNNEMTSKAVRFTNTEDLKRRLEELGGRETQGVFHAAAVSDFRFGQVFTRKEDGSLQPIKSGKFESTGQTLLAELLPTPKIIAGLRHLFPEAFIAGWKYEVEGARADVVQKAQKQIASHATNLCVANGPAYGTGFGLVVPGVETEHVPQPGDLFRLLEALAVQHFAH